MSSEVRNAKKKKIDITSFHECRCLEVCSQSDPQVYGHDPEMHIDKKFPSSPMKINIEYPSGIWALPEENHCTRNQNIFWKQILWAGERYFAKLFFHIATLFNLIWSFDLILRALGPKLGEIGVRLKITNISSLFLYCLYYIFPPLSPPLPPFLSIQEQFSQCSQLDIDGGMELVWKLTIKLLKLSLGILFILLTDLKQVKQAGFFEMLSRNC